MAAALVLALVLVLLIEIYLVSLVAHVVGLPLTLAILVLISALGATLIKREGLRTWRTLRATLGAGRIPARELGDAALVLVGGVLLLTPGFLTDAIGLLLILPPTRDVARRLLTALALRRALGPAAGVGMGLHAARRSTPDPPGSGRVIDGEVLPPEGPRPSDMPRPPDVRRPPDVQRPRP